jgi:polyhydroxybutyrate depolymerase
MNRFLQFSLCILVLTGYVLDLACQTTITASILHNGLTRKYRLHLPPDNSTKPAAPLVFNFHGFTGSGAQQELSSAMNAVSDTAGFLACYPDGINASWNVGWVFGSTADDVGFVSSLIDHLDENYSIDLNKVYACGMSNGGFMSYRLACELPQRIAAIASVTGSMVPGATAACKPGRPVPVMEIHGTADNVVNYNGTPLISSPIPEVLRFWQANNGCDTDPAKIPLPNINSSDGTTVEKWVYQSCLPYGPLEHYRVINGTHSWPGSASQAVGTSQDIHASREIWQFFRQQSLPGSSGIDHGNQKMAVNAFPNPSSGFLQLAFDQPRTYHIEIYNLAGKKVAGHLANGAVAQLDFYDLPFGIYMIRISDGVRIASVRWVKLESN